MNTWVYQKGYPLVEVSWSPNGQELHFHQSHFISSQGPGSGKPTTTTVTDHQTWIIPLTLITQQDHDHSRLIWMNSTRLVVPFNRTRMVEDDGDDDYDESLKLYEWFKVNHLQSGFYRVNYEQGMWRSLTSELANRKHDQHRLSPSDRAGLLDDSLALMRAGRLDVNTALDLTRYLGE